MLKSLVLVAASAATGLAAVVKYDWNVEWISVAPNKFTRPVIGINGKWPNPPVKCNKGDQVIITVNNKLGNESTSIHWHGLFQEGTNHMDGGAQVSQCGIPPGESLTYNFKVNQVGTYWYHSHIGGQYADGLWGPFIVNDDHEPYKKDFDDEYIMTINDWYNAEVPTLLPQIFDKNNTQNRPPIPQAGLVNGADNKVANQTFKFVPGKKYKFRIINTSALAGAILFIDSHKMKVVEIDGVYVKKTEAEQIYVGPAQRYSVIVEALKTKDKNFAFSCVFDVNPNFLKPVVGFPINTTSYLQYDESKPLPGQFIAPAPFKVLDDMTLTPYSNEPIFAAPNNKIKLDFTFGVDAEKIPRAFLNNQSYVMQKVPTLYTALTVGKDAENPIVYGQTNPFIVKKGQTVEITLNNKTPGHHPFHLHGHHFQVVARGDVGAGPYNGDESAFPAVPMQRDTVEVNGQSHIVIRYKANNPGVWLFHCHVEWHVNMGLTATIVESPFELQKSLKIPREHLELCKKQCLPTEGNAAGNTKNVTDLTGANTVHPVPDKGAIFVPATCPPSSTSSYTHTATTTSKPHCYGPKCSETDKPTHTHTCKGGKCTDTAEPTHTCKHGKCTGSDEPTDKPTHNCKYGKCTGSDEPTDKPTHNCKYGKCTGSDEPTDKPTFSCPHGGACNGGPKPTDKPEPTGPSPCPHGGACNGGPKPPGSKPEGECGADGVYVSYVTEVVTITAYAATATEKVCASTLAW